MDAFGKELPKLSIKGGEKVNSILGGVFSVVLYMILLMYAIFKFGHLSTKDNPNVSAFLKVDELFGKSLNLNEN